MAVETATTADGTKQLRRRWAVEDPKAAVLLVHGLGEHSGRYQHVGRFFSQRGFDVETFDNRGFGESGGRRGHVGSFSEFLDDVEERLAARRELDVPVVLFGHSLGGLICARYLVSRNRPEPDLAVLSSPALDFETQAWKRLVAPLLGRLAPTLFVPAEVGGEGLSRDPAVGEAYVNDPLLVAGGTAGLGRESFNAMETTRRWLSSITLPTYVLHGSADPVVPIESTRPFEQLENVTYRVWEGLLHECMNEPEQDEVMAEIEAWLTNRLVALAG